MRLLFRLGCIALLLMVSELLAGSGQSVRAIPGEPPTYHAASQTWLQRLQECDTVAQRTRVFNLRWPYIRAAVAEHQVSSWLSAYASTLSHWAAVALYADGPRAVSVHGDLDDVAFELQEGVAALHVYGDLNVPFDVPADVELIVAGSIGPQATIAFAGSRGELFVGGNLEGRVEATESLVAWIHGDVQGQIELGTSDSEIHILGNLTGTLSAPDSVRLITLEVAGYAPSEILTELASRSMFALRASIGRSDSEPGLYHQDNDVGLPDEWVILGPTGSEEATDAEHAERWKRAQRAVSHTGLLNLGHLEASRKYWRSGALITEGWLQSTSGDLTQPLENPNDRTVLIRGDCLADVKAAASVVSYQPALIHIYGDLGAALHVKGACEIVIGGRITEQGSIRVTGDKRSSVFVGDGCAGSIDIEDSAFITIDGDLTGSLRLAAGVTTLQVAGVWDGHFDVGTEPPSLSVSAREISPAIVEAIPEAMVITGGVSLRDSGRQIAWRREANGRIGRSFLLLPSR